MNYIICSVLVFACTTSLYSSQQNVPKVDMVKYFSEQPLSEIFKLNSSGGISDERVITLKNNPEIAQILLNRISKHPKAAANHLNKLRIMSGILAPQKEDYTVTSDYIKADALYTTIHTIAVQNKQFSEIYTKKLSQSPNAQDLVEATKAGTVLALEKKISEQSNVAESEPLTSYANEEVTVNQHKTSAPLSSDVQLNIQDSDEIPSLEPDSDSEQKTTTTSTISSATETKEAHDLDAKQNCPLDKPDQHKNTASHITRSQSNEQIPDSVAIDILEPFSGTNIKVDTAQTTPPATQHEENDTDGRDYFKDVDQYQEDENASDDESNSATSDNNNVHGSGYHFIEELKKSDSSKETDSENDDHSISSNPITEKTDSEKASDTSDYETISGSDIEKGEPSKRSTDDSESEDDTAYNTAKENPFLSDNKDDISDKTLGKESDEASRSVDQASSDSSKPADDAIALERSRIAKERLAQSVRLAECIAKNGICNSLINAESTENSDQYTSRMTQYHTTLQQMPRKDLIHILKNRNDLVSTIDALTKNIYNPNDQLDDSVIAYYKYIRELCIEAALTEDNQDNNNKNNIQNNKPNTTNKPTEQIANSFFKRHPFALATAITVTAASIYYAYNYWYASEATDSVN